MTTMPFKKSILLAGLFLALALAACTKAGRPAGDSQAAGLALEACQLSSPALPTGLKAECGSLEVPEDLSNSAGKNLRLRIAVLKSVSRNPAGDPLFFIPGGPGEAATESFLVVSDAFQRIRQKRDIVLVDQRGTGGSHALRCPTLEEDQDSSQSEEEAIRRSAQDCLAGLEADPAQYTTAAAAEDLDRVRAALGYETINLYGGSYGTRVALAYLRQFPARVRTVILDGAAPPNWTLGPSVARDAQRALDLLFQRCAAEAECATAFPNLPDKFASLLQTLQQGPVELTLDDPVSGKRIDFTLTYDFFASTIHGLTYTPETAALLPLLIHTAYERNDFSLIAAQGLSNTELLSQSISTGMRLSVLCAEDVPFYDPASQAGEAQALRDGYLGDYFTDVFRTICETWPRGAIPDTFKEPVRSEVPVLILSGEIDPVTPPQNGKLAAETLPNSLHLILPGQGHINIFRGCLPNIATDFVENASIQGLAITCIQSLHPLPFFLTFSGPHP
jgi:pimeloyl-ACP methyl ester carboxylesterase